MEKYILKPSTEPFCWVCTDTTLGIVLKWNEISFNETQEVTMLEDVENPDAKELAEAMRCMAEWIREHHPYTVYPDVKRALGQRIRRRRDDFGLSLREMASQIGLSANNIHRIEQGKYNYTIDNLVKICDILDLGIDLFDGEEEDI